MQNLYGLIGYPISASFSPGYFAAKFEREGIVGVDYRLFPLEQIADLDGLLRSEPQLKGFNVTIPYKKAVIPYLSELDEVARTIGAVNTVAIRNGRLCGTNTDAFGFEASLLSWLKAEHQDPLELSALVLGNGGSARAVTYVLTQIGIPYDLVSRQAPLAGAIGYAEANRRLLNGKKLLIVQTTPLGMAPNTESKPPLLTENLNKLHFVYDLIYNPAETLLLQEARLKGCVTKNGYEMLILQAEKAWSFWTEENNI